MLLTSVAIEMCRISSVPSKRKTDFPPLAIVSSFN